MSYTVIDNAIFEDENLKHTEFRVLTYLIRNFNTSIGYSFPTRAQIANSCKMNKDTVGSVLKSLEKKGYITRKNNPSKAGRNTIYLIHRYLAIESSPVEVVETKVEELIVEDIDYIEEENKLIEGYNLGTLVVPEKSEEQDLNKKVSVLEEHLNKKASPELRELVRSIDWYVLVQADMQIFTNKKDTYCTEKYITNAIFDNMKKPKLKLVK
ncbi:helix-turn-helix domain-containing protein [Clostridioides difficile]|uniref:helix-turn-helix domain-containing protein n=1 Tax=Clostridioides difficile TaxID=1496 RepID=UPI000D1EAF3F|nr:helix-turn-helix domain-containing protein [Clostridioides difficile]